MVARRWERVCTEWAQVSVEEDEKVLKVDGSDGCMIM